MTGPEIIYPDAFERSAIVIGFKSGSPYFAIWLERAPDSGGSPDVGNAITIGKFVAGTKGFVDFMPADNAVRYHYRARHYGAGYDVGAWTSWYGPYSAVSISDFFDLDKAIDEYGGGVVAVPEGGTNIISYTGGDLVFASASTTLQKLALGSTSDVLIAGATAPSWGKIADANVATGAALAVSKMAAGSNGQAIITQGGTVQWGTPDPGRIFSYLGSGQELIEIEGDGASTPTTLGIWYMATPNEFEIWLLPEDIPDGGEIVSVTVDQSGVWDFTSGKLYLNGSPVTAGTGAPTDATYIVQTLHGSLTAERALTDTTSVAWDFATGSQAKANVQFAGTGAANTAARSDHNHTGVYAAASHNQNASTIEAGVFATSVDATGYRINQTGSATVPGLQLRSAVNDGSPINDQSVFEVTTADGIVIFEVRDSGEIKAGPGGPVSGDAFFSGDGSSLTGIAISNTTGTLAVDRGGTGQVSLTQYAVLLGNATSAISTVSGLGTSGYVLTSNGAASAPTWQAAPPPAGAVLLGPSGSQTITPTTPSDSAALYLHRLYSGVESGVIHSGEIAFELAPHYDTVISAYNTHVWRWHAYATSGTATQLLLRVNVNAAGFNTFVTYSQDLSAVFAGAVTASSFSGSGSGLTSLPAGQLTGTVASARLSGAYTGITGLGTLASLSVTGTASAGTFSGSGASLTSLPAGQLTGTVDSARLSGAYTGITGLGTLTTALVTSGVNTTLNGTSGNALLVQFAGASLFGVESDREVVVYGVSTATRGYFRPNADGWADLGTASSRWNRLLLGGHTNPHVGFHDGTYQSYLQISSGTFQIYHNGAARMDFPASTSANTVIYHGTYVPEKDQTSGTSCTIYAYQSNTHYFAMTGSGTITINAASFANGQAVMVYVRGSGASPTITWSGVTSWGTAESNNVTISKTNVYLFHKINGSIVGFVQSKDTVGAI